MFNHPASLRQIVVRPHLAGFFVIIGLCLSCTRSTKHDRGNYGYGAIESYDPTSILSSLPGDTLAKIEALSPKVPAPGEQPFERDPDAGRVYLEWYRTGYAFAWETGKKYLRDQVYRKHLPVIEQAKFLGWFQGNEVGGLARHQADIKSALESLSKEHAKQR